MQILLFTVVGLAVAGLSALIRASISAPEGLEDETGFHFLDADDTARFLAMHQPTLSAGDVLFFK